MNAKLLEKLTAGEARLSFKGWRGEIAGVDDRDIIKVRLMPQPDGGLPKLYDRGTWLVETDAQSFSFTGEIEERYTQENSCMLNVSVLNGLYEVSRYAQESFSDEREAVIIGASSEKFVVNIIKMDPNHAIVRSMVQLPEAQRVWLRYRELAIAGFTSAEQTTENQYIYSLDFSVETMEKRGRIAEMILKENGKGRTR